MYYVFDAKGDDRGHYKTLRGAIAKARRRSAAMEGMRHAVMNSEDSVLVFETRDGVEQDAKALQEAAAKEFADMLAKTRT